MAASWDSAFVQTPDVRLRVRSQTTSGSPLILLHGLGASGAIWQSFARRLTPPWRVIAPDLRGHGASEHTTRGYEASDYAKDIAALIEQLGLHRIPVVGHSLGALTAIALASTRPDLVRSVVLLDPPLDANIENPDIAAVYHLRKAPPGELEAYLGAPILAPIFRAAADGAFEAIMNRPRGAAWTWEAAPSIAVPMLIIQGDPARGGVLGDRVAQDFVARLPHGSLVHIPGATHVLHVSHPQAVADALLKFLSSSQAPT